MVLLATRGSESQPPGFLGAGGAVQVAKDHFFMFQVLPQPLLAPRTDRSMPSDFLSRRWVQVAAPKVEHQSFASLGRNSTVFSGDRAPENLSGSPFSCLQLLELC